MSDIKERLSALYDGELDSKDIDSVIEELEADNNLQKTLSLYSLIGLSLANENKVTDINDFKAEKNKNIFTNIWLSNTLTAAASIILTLFVVNYADFSRMNISVDSTNKIASAVSSREAKEIISNSDEYLVDHIMSVINDPSFMNSNTIDLKNVGYAAGRAGNIGYSNGNEKFQLRIENKNFGLKKIRYWKHGNKMIYIVPISNGRVVTLYGNLSVSSAIEIANSIN
ncbi:sigma-E factor negative regulatory protein [Gammaproteobacteria bacterium]|nr:sigma-E factor negative regulatory protein [Gammaproteobacteria bacterium]